MSDRIKSLNLAIADMLSNGDKLKFFYKFIAQNTHINLHDACQIIVERPNATICFSFAEWNAVGRRVTKGRKGIAFYDADGYKQFVFDAADTHGDTRYQRDILPMKHLLVGLDELNGTNVESGEQSDYYKIRSGVQSYLQDELSGDDERDKLITDGVAFLLYCKTGFPKSAGINIDGLPFSLKENADLVKEIYTKANDLAANIEDAYLEKQNEIEIINDIDEDVVSDEPIISPDKSKENIATDVKVEKPNNLPDWYAKYVEYQKQYPKDIVVTRLGDFYEVFGENAVRASKHLDLTLTGRAVQGLPERVPMCGFPYHAAELYIEKLRKHSGVIVMETDKEPVRILPLIEHSENSKQTNGSPFDELIEIEDDDDPFEDEDESIDEDFDNDVDNDVDEAVVADTTKVKVKGKSIRNRKKKSSNTKQLSIFDSFDEQTKDDESEQDKLIKDILCGGSGVEGGKIRIYDTYQKDPTVDEFAKFLSHEYGIGGRSGPNEPTEMHDGKGISITSADKKTEINLKWKNVANRIADLIDEGKYLNEAEKKRYAQVVRFREERANAKTDEERIDVIVNQIVEYGTENAYCETFNEYPHFLEDYIKFYSEHRQEIADKLSKRDEVASADKLTQQYNDYINVSFKLEYCPRWQARNERIAQQAKKLRGMADKLIEQHVQYALEEPTDDDYSTYYVYPDEVGENDYLFIKDNRDEFIEYIRRKDYVDNAEFSMDKISVTYDVKKLREFANSSSEERKIKSIVESIVDEGTKNTSEGNWIVYFEEFKEDEQFVREHKNEICTQLALREEVAEVSLDDDCIDTTYYLDYCQNYEGEQYEEREQDNKSVTPDANRLTNRFKELSVEGKSLFDSFQQRAIREPTNSTWGEVQYCTTIAKGIYDVSTAGHGGVIISAELAPHILSHEALEKGYFDNGYYCYEEDCDASIPLRELFDKRILTPTNVYFTQRRVRSNDASIGFISYDEANDSEKANFYEEWNGLINRSLGTWNPEYWEARKQAQEQIEKVVENKTENTDLASVLDQTELGGAKTRFRNNVAAIKLVNKLYAENRNATDEERKVLAKFVGWGGLAQAFDGNNPQWKREFSELKDLLSQEDYEQAKSSTLNAYYTAKDVIDGIYTALERFGVKGNNRILEPAMGTGNFFGFMPKEISNGAKLYGVELDNLTGRIAAKLYPQANVQIKGFEDTTFPNDKFDVVVGNVPFGGYGVADSDYNKYNFKVHDYFLAKSIDKVKPNGIVAIVTSKGTMDKLNPSARKYVAERAELLGAIRLPNNAFKQTAGTEAVADILFLRKREERINVESEAVEWLSTGKTEEGYEINQYFINHPEMVLGTLVEDIGLYGGNDVTVKPDGRNLAEAIGEAVKNLPQDFYNNPEASPEQDEIVEVDYNVKPMCYKADNGRLYMRVGDEMVEQPIPKYPKDAYQRIQAMIALRDELHNILNVQMKGCSDEVLQREQELLRIKYDAFVKRYGNLNSQTNTKLFKDDGDSALLFACEDIDEETKEIRKADVFSKRTIRPYIVPTSTDDSFEALQISKNERGKVDIAYIEELTGKSYDEIVFELGDTVFRDPDSVNSEDKYSGFVTAEEYLSGNVVSKLEIARREAEKLTEYKRNVDALEKVQPEPLTASEISVRLGQTWIDKTYYEDFYCYLIGASWWHKNRIELFYNPHDSSWRLDQKESVRYDTDMRQRKVYGTDRAPAYRIFMDCMNLRPTTIYDTVEENGKEKRVINHAETIAAREKQNKIKEEFANWIFAKPERREELEATYNRLFNRTRLPSFDGSYLQFPEMNPAVELKPHQKNAVHRIITSNDSTLLHHVVGSGKTFTMIASIMKMRQLGLCKKAMVAVPNHLVQQWASEWRKLYPNAQILVASKEDLEKDNRQKFVSKVALGDWDGIIIAQSSFAKIPVSYERQERKLREEIQAVEDTIERQWAENGMPRGAVKNLETIKKNKEKQLKKLMDDKNKDNVLTFESLGVDYLYIDEAHYYKNLFLYTKMSNVAGISTAASQRASDLKLKCEYLQEQHGNNRGVVFATGTPISNSMTEMYTMQTYLQPSVLKDLGISFFDGWAADFGETVIAMELSPSGQGYRARTRFAKFTNLPELLKMYRSFADVQTADMVKLDVPDADRKVITLKPSDTVIDLAEDIADRADQIYGGGVPPEIDNMLKVTSDGKKLALDPRCFVPSSKDEEGSKLNEAATRIYEVWSDTADIKGTQIVFCDLSTPKRKYEEYVYGVDFDAYNDLKHKLIEKGIPSREIAFIHDANTDEQKQSLFDNVNSGNVRVLIGSTEKCGAGTNVQKRLVALHHLDTLYRPSDMEQREGRIIRQGNTNKTVRIYTYVTERTFDSYSYQILENKQRFISQINKGDLTVREAEDIDETTLSYAEIKAITAANPKIKRKMEVDTEIARLRVLEGQYRKNLYSLQDKIRKSIPEDIQRTELLIERVTADNEHLNKSKPDNPEAFEISVNGMMYTDKKEGGRALTDALYSSSAGTVVAEYCGFKICINPIVLIGAERDITLSAEGQYTVKIGESATGNLQRIDNFIEDFPKRKERLQNKLQQFKDDLETAKQQVEKPFEHQERLAELLSEQAELNAELNLNKREEVIVDDGNDVAEVAMALPNTDVDFIDNEDKVANMKVAVLPDYCITQENMHKYGYTWDGMLPLTRRTAIRLWGMGLQVNKLNSDDTHRETTYEDFTEPKGMYGMEKPTWNNFLRQDGADEYLTARLEVAKAASELVNKDMSYVDERFTINFSESNFEEKASLKKYLKDRPNPNMEQVKAYLPSLVEEFTGRVWNSALSQYGWIEDDVIKGIVEHIDNPELKEYATMYVLKNKDKEEEVDVKEQETVIQDNKAVDYRAEVVKSVVNEFDNFKNEMLTKTPEEVFLNNYKIHCYNGFMSTIEVDENDLLQDDYQALYREKGNILQLLFDDFIDSDGYNVDSFEDMRDFIHSYCERYHADIFNIKPIYLNTLDYAVQHNERDAYFDSHFISIDCRTDLTNGIKNNYDGMHLKSGFEDEIIQKYGLERVEYVLATTVTEQIEDGRYSPDNKKWAQSVAISPEEDERKIINITDAHPAVINGLIDRIRKKAMESYKASLVEAMTNVDTLMESKEEKIKAYYAFNHQRNANGREYYQAYMVDNENGEIFPIFTTDFSTQEELEAEWQRRLDSGIFERAELIKCEPQRLLAISNDIIERHKEKETKMEQEKYLNVTPQGYKVLSIVKDKDDRNIAIIQRENKGDFVVAARYDTSDGTWAQGIYDFPTLEDAEKYRKENYGFEDTRDTDKKKWLSYKVSPEAVIRKLDKSTLLKMPKGSGYEDCVYYMYNDRIRESTYMTDIESDGRVRALEIRIPEDSYVNLYKDGEKVIDMDASKFVELVDGSMSDKYSREERARIRLPREAVVRENEVSVLFSMPNDSKYAGYNFFLPNSVLDEDVDSKDNGLVASLTERFKVTLRKDDEKVEITSKEFAELVNGKVDYASKVTEPKDKADVLDDGWETVGISEKAVITNYENSTLLRMPKGEYEGFVYYIPSGMVHKDEKGLSLHLPEDFEIHLKTNASDEKIDLSVEEFIAAVADKKDEDYETFRKPSEEARKEFEKVEAKLRTNVPEEMLNKPNWVVVRTRENKDTGRLDKFLIDVHTGKFAESDNPETWTDFDSACEYAKENGGVCLAYALDGKDGIACIDLDGCMQENGDFSNIANKSFMAAKGSYAEKSVSGKGLHIFGKTKGADLRSFSKDKTLEYYQDTHFIAMTGDYYGSSELKSFDTPEMKKILESKLEKRTEWTNTGTGIEGLSSMDDREMLDKAFNAKNGDTVKRLYNGEDLRGNHSNSDMSLMNYLAFWSNHDIDQMLRVFATSGLCRSNKSQSYYEHTAIKAVKGTPVYNPPKASNNAPKRNGGTNTK